MIAPTKRLLILDQSLQGFGGHYYEYDLAVARAARAAGFAVIVAAHRGATPSLTIDEQAVTPWFSTLWFEANRPPAAKAIGRLIDRLPEGLQGPTWRLARNLRRALGGGGASAPAAFGAEAAAFLKREGAAARDHVLIHTISLPELASLASALKEREGPAIHVVLRRDPAEAEVAREIAGAFAAIAASPARERVFLYTDTDELAEGYRSAAPGFDFAVTPVPVISAGSGGPRAPGPVRFVFLGDARREKGFHRMPIVAAALADELRSGRAEIIAQANDAAKGGDPLTEQARASLRSYDAGLSLIESVLDDNAFQALLESADIVVAPYEQGAYRRRSSGVLMRALVAGKPAIAPANTWLAAQLTPETGVTYEDDKGLAFAVREAMRRWPDLTAAAAARAAAYREACDPQRLVELMMARTGEVR